MVYVVAAALLMLHNCLLVTQLTDTNHTVFTVSWHGVCQGFRCIWLSCSMSGFFVHALLSHCRSACATDVPSLGDRQPDTTPARESTCQGCMHSASLNPAFPCLCWLWCGADHGWLTLLSHILGLSSCSTPSLLVNVLVWSGCRRV